MTERVKGRTSRDF